MSTRESKNVSRGLRHGKMVRGRICLDHFHTHGDCNRMKPQFRCDEHRGCTKGHEVSRSNPTRRMHQQSQHPEPCPNKKKLKAPEAEDSTVTIAKTLRTLDSWAVTISITLRTLDLSTVTISSTLRTFDLWTVTISRTLITLDLSTITISRTLRTLDLSTVTISKTPHLTCRKSSLRAAVIHLTCRKSSLRAP